LPQTSPTTSTQLPSLCWKTSSKSPPTSLPSPAAGLLGFDARGVLAREQLERLDRVGGHLGELDDDRLVVGRELRVLVSPLDQPEARPVAGDRPRRWRLPSPRGGLRRANGAGRSSGGIVVAVPG
jgi:hypothetical protein